MNVDTMFLFKCGQQHVQCGYGIFRFCAQRGWIDRSPADESLSFDDVMKDAQLPAMNSSKCCRYRTMSPERT